MKLKERLENLHFNHGDRIMYRIRVTVGLIIVAALTHSAEAFGIPLGTAAIYANLAVSFVWVWE